MSVHCKCGFHVEGIESELKAEIIADVHEAKNVRSAHRHATTIIHDMNPGRNTRLVWEGK